MKNIYLYGASDDCMECESDFGDFESYVGIKLGDNVYVNYVYDGDWGLWIDSEIPASWKVKAIVGNCAAEVRTKPHGGQFIHIQVPDDEAVTITELGGE